MARCLLLDPGMTHPIIAPRSDATWLTDPRSTAPLLLLASRRRSQVLEVGLAPHSESNLWAGFQKIEGVFVATWDAPPLDAPVELALALPGSERVRAPGRVEWLREPTPEQTPGVGVRFGRLSVRDATLLALFARNRQPYFYDAGSR